MDGTARRTRALAATAGVIVALGLVGASANPASADPSPRAGVTTRVSVNSTGEQANGYSYETSISADGRWVAFSSEATNLVPGDTNDAEDVFVRDRMTGTTQRVSVRTDGSQGDGMSGRYWLGISADGQYVAFWSLATNLVGDDTNERSDVFVRDLVAGTTQRVSIGSGGQANRDSYGSAISANGRYVAFYSGARNLVADDTNQSEDVFVRDLVAGTTRRVSVGPGGRQANSGSFDPAISADGRHVAFVSRASNLVAGDTLRTLDVFVRDLVAGRTRRVSMGVGGQQPGNSSHSPVITAHGRHVAFHSYAGNLVAEDDNRLPDVFVRDLATATTRRVSVGPGGRDGNFSSYSPAISANGRYVAFHSFASNLMAGDTNNESDIFVRDRGTATTRRVSIGPNGQQANRDSYSPAISADGPQVAFESYASNLVAGDTNDTADIFVRTRNLQ